METFRHYADVTHRGGTVAAIGNFDGVHRGHQALLGTARTAAKNLGISTAVLTFDPHPTHIINPQRSVAPLTSIDDRLSLLAAHGTDVALAQRFDLDFAALSPDEFVELVLIRGLRAKAVVVGYNFGFGARRSGTVDDLRRIGEAAGFSVYIVQSINDARGDSISSSRIRNAVTVGDLPLATAQLGRRHFSTGIVGPGAQRGRTLGFPTANVAPETKALPPTGVYAGWLDTGSALYGAVANLGEAPTFGHHEIQTLEVHALTDEQLDLYGRRIRFYYGCKLRDETRFPDAQTLRQQIAADAAAASEWCVAKSSPARFAL